MKCKICKKDFPEEIISIECPNCYMNGFNNERNKILKIIDEFELAELLHKFYEIEAKQNGWKTQKSCQVKFKDLPKKNKTTMINVARNIKKELLHELLHELLGVKE